MKKVRLTLGREALLYDSPLYILKAFVGILLAYVLFKNHPVAGKDMISVLFGFMLTLEPVNRSGLKVAINQVAASALGGVGSAILVALFGVNFITVPLCVALTMYMALTINWRFVSPFAIFTAIYMTQYIQMDAMGEPSVLITLQVRMYALVAGISIALLCNYLFSLFFYKGMLKKRMKYVKDALVALFEEETQLVSKEDFISHKSKLIGLISDIDAFENLLKDMSHRKSSKEVIASYLQHIDNLRDLAHYYLSGIMQKTAPSDIQNISGDMAAILNKVRQI